MHDDRTALTLHAADGAKATFVRTTRLPEGTTAGEFLEKVKARELEGIVEVGDTLALRVESAEPEDGTPQTHAVSFTLELLDDAR